MNKYLIPVIQRIIDSPVFLAGKKTQMSADLKQREINLQKRSKEFFKELEAYANNQYTTKPPQPATTEEQERWNVETRIIGFEFEEWITLLELTYQHNLKMFNELYIKFIGIE